MMILRQNWNGVGRYPLLSKAKLLVLSATVFILSSCGEFGGFDSYEKPDVGDVTKVEAYFTEENLAKFYDSVSQPEEGYASCSARIGNGKLLRAWMKVRGYTSRGEPKKNFSIKIEKDGRTKVYALMHEADTWFKNRIVMYAYNNYSYKGSSLTVAPDTEAVALFVNGTYYGYYAMVEVYDEEMLDTYKSGSRMELFKIEIQTFDSSPLYENTEKKIPKDKDFSTMELLITNLNRMSDAEWNDWVQKYVDIDDFIRYMVVQNYFGVEDTSTHNYYIYNYDKLIFLPWDQELGMRLDYDSFLGNNKLVKRILAAPCVHDVYMQAMKDFVADTAFLEKLMSKVYEWYDLSYKAISSDPVFYLSVEDAKRSRDLIIDFIDRRGICEAYLRHFSE